MVHWRHAPHGVGGIPAPGLPDRLTGGGAVPRTPAALRRPNLRPGRALVLAVVTLVVAGLLAADRPAPAAAATMWGDAVPPNVQVASDPAPVTLGTGFRPTVPGQVVGLRYWSAGAGATAPQGSLWNAAGERLVSATFATPRAAGWQTVWLHQPVRVAAGAAYVVAYHEADGRYPVTQHFLGGSTSALLEVTPGSSGVFGYGGAEVFPRSPWEQSQYWVDVVFRGDAGATPASLRTADPTPAPSSDGAPTTAPTASPTASPLPDPSPTPSASSAAAAAPRQTPASRPRTGAAAVPSKAPPAAPAAPLPGQASKPGPSNTGVPAGTVLTPAAGMTVTTPNQVLSGLDIHGEVVIQAPGVQIRSSRITGDDYYGVLVKSGSVTITDTEISGFENAIAGDGWSAARVNIHSVTGDGVKLGSSVTLRDSWIHDLTPAPGAHADGAQMQDGVTNLVVEHNTIEPGDAANSAIFLAPDLGPSTDGPVTITGNWLDYGGYALFCLDGSDGRYLVHNITITGNRFGANSAYGEFRITVPVTFAGNVDAAGQPLSL